LLQTSIAIGLVLQFYLSFYNK